MKKPLAIGVAAAIALGSTFSIGASSPANAMPLGLNALAVKDAAQSDVIDVHWRRHRRGAAFAGLALGVIGAIIAHDAYRRHHRRHYYGSYGYYGPPPCIRRHGVVYCR
jgi:lipid-binding SYLF domain-containing protein